MIFINSPIILTKLPFDALNNATIRFTYSGNQIFAHRILIKDNATNNTVYDKKSTTQISYATIPANTLQNGKTYAIQVSVFDHTDKESPFSSAVIIKCLKTPVFEFANVADSMVVRNSYLDAEIRYEQEDGELLNSYTVNVYAQNQVTLVFTSGVKLANQLIVRVPSLTDDTTYYIQAVGHTVNGMNVSTPKVIFHCDYIKPDVFLAFRADNIPDEGSVKLSSNFVLIEGESDPEDLIYIDGRVDLTHGEKVWFGKGYSVKDFCEQIFFTPKEDFVKFTTWNMKTAMAYMTWNYGYFDYTKTKKYYVELISYRYVGGRLFRYIQSSNLVDPLLPDEQAHVWVKHDNNLFDVVLTKLKLESGEPAT